MIKTYLNKILEVSKIGDAREESYYFALQKLLQDYANFKGKTKSHITVLPKKTEAGNPDFRVWDGKQYITGYIEAKAPTIDNLDQIESTDQIKRYLRTFPNIILTNFFEFRLYHDGSIIDKAQIARPFIIQKLKTIPPVEKESAFLSLLEKFFSFSLPKVYNAKTLAIELAKRTRFLKDEVVAEELKEEEAGGKGFILGFYEAFRKYLISGLTKEDFADLYSQTITYGLFAARTRSENEFNRKLAYDNIPHTIGILRDVFEFISLGKLPPQMEWIIDDISEVLAVTDVKNILHQYFHEGKGKDPIVHFYETFLSEYDPETREKRGVYYTPEAVVSFIVRSIHKILKEYFNKSDGFADDKVTVLDPAAGTLTFLAEAAKLAVKEFVFKYGEGGKSNFIKENILNNFYAFELMMAPYAVGHLKISFLLEELGYKLQSDDRFKLYLTNTLEMEELAQTELPGMASLSEESHLAGKIKKEKRILVILGNPPYSGISSNQGEWIDNLLKKGYQQLNGSKDNGYYRIDDKPLHEKNPKWLQDDYVKFIRFAQWKLDQAGEGILGFITNHSYLDNPTFRGMRQSLMNSFDKIYILDLHGNSLKKERSPDGSKDVNVFDIQQGVAIALFIKRKNKRKECNVYHSEIWGMREDKYNWLLENTIAKTKWKPIKPKSEFYLFIPRSEELLKAYEINPKINDIFKLNSVGIVTARDKLTIRWTPEEVWSTVLNFSRLDRELARLTYNLGNDARDWKIELAQNDLKNSGFHKKRIIEIFYRAFDRRYTYYTGRSRGFICMPRPEVMRHILSGENLCLIFTRSTSSGKPFNHIFCSKHGILGRFFPDAACITYFCPLYLYPGTYKRDLFSDEKKLQKRDPNISPVLFDILAEFYKKETTPEEIFYYIYGILFSNTYRRKYADFLKIDFPRIPFTRDYISFSKMLEYGKRLVELHLLKSKEIDPPASKFQGKGDNKVNKLGYDEKNGHLYFNKTQYFEGISKELYSYQIGGYRVCDRWLKDRKGKLLSTDDIKHFCKVITSLKRTISIQKEIDKLYPKIENKIIEFKDNLKVN